MPKVNVYLNDKLASLVRALDLPLSEICQRALQQEANAELPMMELTPRARKLFIEAKAEATSLGHDYVGVEHLALALFADHQSVPAKTLTTFASLTDMRARLLEVVASSGYNQSSNQVIDKDGNLIGFLVEDADGNARVVDAKGRPVKT